MRICHKAPYNMPMLKTKQLFANLTRINLLQSPYAKILTQHNVKTCCGRREGQMWGRKQRQQTKVNIKAGGKRIIRSK